MQIKRGLISLQTGDRSGYPCLGAVGRQVIADQNGLRRIGRRRNFFRPSGFLDPAGYKHEHGFAGGLRQASGKGYYFRLAGVNPSADISAMTTIPAFMGQEIPSAGRNPETAWPFREECP